MLRLHVTSPHQSITIECADLIQKLLSTSVLFEHDPSEIPIWLQFIPRLTRKTDAKGPDGFPLVNEMEMVIDAVDQCILRCLKSPYTYVEEALGAFSDSVDTYSPSLAPSPLLMTLSAFFEDLMMRRISLPAYGTLSIATYLRKLIIQLSLKQPDTSYTHKMLSKFEAICHCNTLQSIMELRAIHQEAQLLQKSIMALRTAVHPRRSDSDQAVLSLLEQVEGLSPGKTAATYYPGNSHRF